MPYYLLSLCYYSAIPIIMSLRGACSPRRSNLPLTIFACSQGVASPWTVHQDRLKCARNDMGVEKTFLDIYIISWIGNPVYPKRQKQGFLKVVPCRSRAVTGTMRGGVFPPKQSPKGQFPWHRPPGQVCPFDAVVANDDHRQSGQCA
jgi:hypothetical protein